MAALPSVEDKIKNSTNKRRINVPDTQTFNEKQSNFFLLLLDFWLFV